MVHVDELYLSGVRSGQIRSFICLNFFHYLLAFPTLSFFFFFLFLPFFVDNWFTIIPAQFVLLCIPKSSVIFFFFFLLYFFPSSEKFSLSIFLTIWVLLRWRIFSIQMKYIYIYSIYIVIYIIYSCTKQMKSEFKASFIHFALLCFDLLRYCGIVVVKVVKS